MLTESMVIPSHSTLVARKVDFSGATFSPSRSHKCSKCTKACIAVLTPGRQLRKLSTWASVGNLACSIKWHTAVQMRCCAAAGQPPPPKGCPKDLYVIATIMTYGLFQKKGPILVFSVFFGITLLNIVSSGNFWYQIIQGFQGYIAYPTCPHFIPIVKMPEAKYCIFEALFTQKYNLFHV